MDPRRSLHGGVARCRHCWCFDWLLSERQNFGLCSRLDRGMATSGHCWNRYTLVYLGALVGHDAFFQIVDLVGFIDERKKLVVGFGVLRHRHLERLVWNWTSPGFLGALCHMSNPVVARNLPLLFSHRLETLACNGAPFDYVRGHECWSPAMGIFMMAMWWLGSKVVDTLCEWLALCVMGVVMALFITANTWPSSTQTRVFVNAPPFGPGHRHKTWVLHTDLENGTWTREGRFV